MNIGIDLDNTIVDYDLSFSAAAASLDIVFPAHIVAKHDIREFVRLQHEGEKKWQQLQGLAYGKFVAQHARLYPGVKRFLWRCRQRGHTVKVISHKTEFGHFDDKKLSLRQCALLFLEAAGLLGGQQPMIQEVVFKPTREEKIETILLESFSWFIDDLPEVILGLDDSKELTTVCFNPLNSEEIGSSLPQRVAALSDWQQIDSLINGAWTDAEVAALAFELTGSKVESIEKISAGGNAGVFRLVLEDKRVVKLKIYPVDAGHDRLRSEYIATEVIGGLEGNDVAMPICRNDELGIGIYEWIEGERVSSYTEKEIGVAIAFLKKLHAARNHPEFSTMPAASAACFSLQDIEKQFSKRLAQFEQARREDERLTAFFDNAFLPVAAILFQTARENFPVDELKGTALPRELQTVSPSDFGFHNVIRRNDGSLVFLDFEYFGWDDPVKLMSDFSFHPGMNLSDEQVAFWLKGSMDVYGIETAKRLQVLRPLYGLIWCLILLNDFRPEIWQRRLLADKSKADTKQQTLDLQFKRAAALLEKIQSAYSDILITN